MTAQLSWHVQNCEQIRILQSNLKQKEFSQDLNYELVNSLWDVSLASKQTHPASGI